jgi:hypothetical protein
MEKLANSFFFFARDPGFNVGIDRIFSYSVYIIIEFKSVGPKFLSNTC